MALNVQNDSGTVADANAYVTVAYFKAYHDARGNDYSAATSDPLIEKAIIKATDYLDQRFRFRGSRANLQSTQPTAWPRLDVVDDDDNWVNGIPDAVKKACCEYALRAISATLNPDPTSDDYGRSVRRISKTVGPISKDVEYDNSSVLLLPKYPAADRLLAAAGLLVSGTTLARG